MAARRTLPQGGAIRLNSLGARIVLFFVALLVLVQGVGALLVMSANSQIAGRLAM